MSIFRSEDMHLYKFSTTADSAYQVVEALGKMGDTVLIDLNKGEQAFSLLYQKEIKRCTNVLKHLDFIEAECRKHNVPSWLPSCFDEFMHGRSNLMQEYKCASLALFTEIEKWVTNHESFLSEQSRWVWDMKANYMKLLEHKSVIAKASGMIHIESGREDSFIKIEHVAGIAQTVDIQRMKRQLFRATWGNALVVFSPMKWALEGKSVYVVSF